jgi:hypothetical protein
LQLEEWQTALASLIGAAEVSDDEGVNPATMLLGLENPHHPANWQQA